MSENINLNEENIETVVAEPIEAAVEIAPVAEVAPIVDSSKDDGNNIECLLDGKPLKNSDKIEIEWYNGIIERTNVIIEKKYVENSAHNDRWTQEINYPFTKIMHNGTEIKISL